MFVLGTAGHVDHGKSTLIHRLTGIDPDRLAEEKKRGLTIDLGFAWTTLPSGREVGIVDVPGHERFVPNMLAGAGACDAVMFVVDANEGWRQQSEEHLAILDLLGIRNGVVALTKIDVARNVDPESVRARLAGSALEGAEIVPISAITGDGMDSLVAAIDRMLDKISEPADRGRPRLSVDRSFTIKGSGTVVTGTLGGGTLRPGDGIEILPAGTRARIRSIQTHRTDRAEAQPTSRVALNLAGLERHEIRRGDTVVKPGQWLASTLLDVELRGVRSLEHPVTSRGAFLLYAGTAEVPARLRFLGATTLSAGETAFARLRLGEPVVAAPGDRIVLRDTGRHATVAGGRVLDAHPVDERPGERRIEQLRIRASAAGFGDLTVEERGAVRVEDLEPLSGSALAPAAMRLQTFFVSSTWLANAKDRIAQQLRAFHTHSPLERGMAREALRATGGIDDPRLFDETLATLSPDVLADGPLVRLATHRVTLSPELDAKWAHVMEETSGFSPPGYEDLIARYGRDLIKALVESGELVRISDDIVFSAESVQAAKAAIAEAFNTEGGLTASRVREILGTSRKYAIPLLEHLDAAGFTKRDGDVRRLRA